MTISYLFYYMYYIYFIKCNIIILYKYNRYIKIKVA